MILTLLTACYIHPLFVDDMLLLESGEKEIAMMMRDSCAELFKQIHDEMVKRANNDLRPYGITMVQVTALILLSQKERHEMPLKELEHELHVAQSTAAGIVMRLEQKDFVTSLGSKDDGRIKIVRITQKGMDVYEKTETDRIRVEQTILSGLDEREKEELLPLLTKIRASLD